MNRGLFIAFEGGEASGKSTQAVRFAEHLGALPTREPGGTLFGEKVRQLFQMDTATRIDPHAEALLVASARAQHVVEVIKPALLAGKNVVTDRFTGSSLAYQGYGRGLSTDELLRISKWASQDIQPDLNILIDVSREVALSRRTVDVADRFEQENEEFHQRVLNGFRELAAASPETWITVSGESDIDSVGKLVWDAFNSWNDKQPQHD